MKSTIKNLELRLRGMMPPVLRKTYRIYRSFQNVETLQSLPSELVEDCRFCASRHHMLDHLPHEAVVAELGTHGKGILPAKSSPVPILASCISLIWIIRNLDRRP